MSAPTLNTAPAGTAPAITPELLAELLASRAHRSAVLVQDALGVLHVIDRPNRYQLDDPDVIVLLTRAAAVEYLAAAAATVTAELAAAGVLL